MIVKSFNTGNDTYKFHLIVLITEHGEVCDKNERTMEGKPFVKKFKPWKIITEKGAAETTGMHLASIFILKLHLKKKIF